MAYTHRSRPQSRDNSQWGSTLVGFERNCIEPGESRMVTLRLPARQLAFCDEAHEAFVVEPCSFDVLVGSYSQDIRLKTALGVK
jgi:beta-glucosidase